MFIGVAGLAAGLVVGGVVLVGALGIALQRTAETEARESAKGVARLVNEKEVPEPLPVVGDVRVQVVDVDGRVLAASIGADRLVAILYRDELPKARAGKALLIPGERLGIEGPVRVVGEPAGEGGTQTVLVARSMADLTRSVRLLRITLMVAFPLLLVALAAVAWRVVGLTLRPVEALRRGAEEITGGARPGQLPVPDSQDEIHRLAVTLNGMLDRLEAARVRQRAFVADAAHELRSPLTNMRTELEVAQRLGDRTDWADVGDDLLADIQRLSRLVDDLLLLARSDDGGARAARAAVPVELGDLVATVAERYPAVEVPRPECPLWTMGEPDALARVVANLLDNAVRHTSTRVVVGVSADGPYQLVTVTDDGPGIPVADRERVFDRFTRLDDARARDAGGSGLGLAIVRELTRRHGGTVVLEGAAPGVRAELRLPAIPTPD
ncbi:sensor histidine kinase [Micromonospora sp. CPCC 206061]|uniref:sensor histidine kinase n=1 Tax=Micromonospora sp. CPCC 206061 TaxID=3122410 RepID=UPI002FF22BF3